MHQLLPCIAQKFTTCGINTPIPLGCVYTEKLQSEGRVDCIVETPSYIYIFEFKLDGSADEALLQIEEKGYARPYEADSRKLFKVGIVFSSETGTISEFKVME